MYKLLAKIPRRFMFPIALLGHGAMQARQLRGIKRRAETGAGGVQRAAAALGSRLNPETIWRELDKASFAVIGYSTPSGEPRSSGIVFKTVGRRLYLAVARDSWKARHIATGAPVAVTVPVRRGGLLSPVFPIPPATVSFRSTAIVHPAGSVDIGCSPGSWSHCSHATGATGRWSSSWSPKGAF